jgi:ribosomal protein L17
MSYLYAYLNPNERGRYCYDQIGICFLYEPIYIGKGSSDRRKLFHIWESRNNRKSTNDFKSRVIRKILESNKEPIIQVLCEDEDEKNILEREIEFIAVIGRRDKGLGPLTNLTDGGEGVTGFKHREEYKHKFSYNKGRRMPKSESHRKKLSQALMGHVVSEETRKKISDTKIKQYENKELRKKISEATKKKSLKGREHPNSKKYKVTSPEGEVFIIQDGVKNFCSTQEIHDTYLFRSLKEGNPLQSGKYKGWNMEFYDEDKKNRDY